MANIFEIKSCETMYQEELNDKFFTDKMTYRAKVIGNAYDPDSFKGGYTGPLDYLTVTYILSGLKIEINTSSITRWDGSISERGYDIRIQEGKLPNKILYQTGDEYKEADWLQIFDGLFEEALSKSEQNEYTKKRH